MNKKVEELVEIEGDMPSTELIKTIIKKEWEKMLIIFEELAKDFTGMIDITLKMIKMIVTNWRFWAFVLWSKLIVKIIQSVGFRDVSKDLPKDDGINRRLL